jgi:hypothetical protein
MYSFEFKYSFYLFRLSITRLAKSSNGSPASISPSCGLYQLLYNYDLLNLCQGDFV